MIFGIGVRVQIERNAEAAQRFDGERVIFFRDRARRRAFFFRRHGDGRAVRVRTGHGQNLIAAQPMIARENIVGDKRAGHMPQMQGPIHIGPRRITADLIGHGKRSERWCDGAMVR